MPDLPTTAATSTSETPEAPWLAVACSGAAFIAVTFGLARYGYGLLLPDMRADLGIDATTAGAISSLSYATYFVTNLGVVAIVERWGARLAIALATVCAAAGMAVIASATGAGTLTVGVALAGAAPGFAFPPYAQIVHLAVDDRRRATVWATVSSGTGWGVAIAGPVAILAGDQWRLAWAAFVGIGLVVGYLALRVAPQRIAGTPRSAQIGLRAVARRPGARPLLLAALLAGTGSSVWWSFSVDALRAAEVDTSLARWTYAIGGAASLLGSLAGLAVARIGLASLNRASAALVAVSIAVFGLTTSSWWAAWSTATLFGAAYATVIATLGLWSARVLAERPAAGLAAVNAAQGIGTLVGPAAAGLVIDHVDHRTAFLLAGAVLLPVLVLSPPRRDAASRRT